MFKEDTFVEVISRPSFGVLVKVSGQTRERGRDSSKSWLNVIGNSLRRLCRGLHFDKHSTTLKTRL